jgi:peptidylprolyl isomerase
MSDAGPGSEQGRAAARLAAVIAIVGVIASVYQFGFRSSTSAHQPTEVAMTTDGQIQTTASGLQILDSELGAGDMPTAGQTVVVHYTGWLYENGEKGAKFDSSLDRGQPFSFTIGQGQVIRGWDEGLATMAPGGKRTLIIPPDLGYGDRGAGGAIPGGATLMFDVELLEVR